MVGSALVSDLGALPFLFLTFLLLRTLRRRTNKEVGGTLHSTNGTKPLLNSLLNYVPRYNFSIFTTGLCSNNIVALNALLTMFLTASSRTLVVLVSRPSQNGSVLLLLLFGVIVNVATNCVISLFMGGRPRGRGRSVNSVYGKRRYRYSRRGKVFMPTLARALGIFNFLLIFALTLGFTVRLLNTSELSRVLLNGAFFRPLVTTLVKLVPGYTTSILLARVCLNKTLDFTSMVTKLYSKTNVNLVILFEAGGGPHRGLGVLKLLCKVSTFSNIVVRVFAGLVTWTERGLEEGGVGHYASFSMQHFFLFIYRYSLRPGFNGIRYHVWAFFLTHFGSTLFRQHVKIHTRGLGKCLKNGLYLVLVTSLFLYGSLRRCGMIIHRVTVMGNIALAGGKFTLMYRGLFFLDRGFRLVCFHLVWSDF